MGVIQSLLTISGVIILQVLGKIAQDQSNKQRSFFELVEVFGVRQPGLQKRAGLFFVFQRVGTQVPRLYAFFKQKRKKWNPKQPFINGCFNWMIPNLYIGNGCFTKHLFINGCLGFQAGVKCYRNFSPCQNSKCQFFRTAVSTSYHGNPHRVMRDTLIL